jgi:hypothetical protein
MIRNGELNKHDLLLAIDANDFIRVKRRRETLYGTLLYLLGYVRTNLYVIYAYVYVHIYVDMYIHTCIRIYICI